MSNDKLKELEVAIFTGRNICLFGLLYYFVTLLYIWEEREG